VTASSREPAPRLLAAYLSDECSASEAAEVLRWAQSSPENTARLERLRAAWNTPPSSSTDVREAWSSDEMWSAIAGRMVTEEPLRLVPPSARAPRREFGSRRNVAGWATIAASLLIFAGVWAERRAAGGRENATRAVQEAAREYRTEVGQRASVTLPDGSAFQLGPLSTLRVPSGYGKPDRVVELDGDGYFNVVHDQAHPFSVRTSRTTIRDIGTRFVVRARSTERRVEVAVADGQVAIDRRAPARFATPADSAPLMVSAGEAALVDETGVARRLSKASVDARFAWTRGELAFDHVPVPAVLSELGRWYGRSFVVADNTLDTVRLTTVLKGETMLEALVVLEAALDVDARVAGDRVTLTRHIAKDR
jgi:transmembrane sensor